MELWVIVEIIMDDIDASQELVSWLILIHATSLSPIKFKKLLLQYGAAHQLVCAETCELFDAGIKYKTIQSFREPNWEQIEIDIDWLGAADNHFISCMDRRYPTLLQKIPDPPIGLFVSGNIDVLSAIQIAIIGTRKPTPGGRRTAIGFAREIGNLGITVTSGLAVGIDTAAHMGALSSNSPTIAVLGNGLDMIYPKANSQLADKICESGAIVSEFPVGTKPLPSHFPRRNRIISGLSVGTVVVEAALQSGSLITARLAMEQGREVFAIPGSIFNPVSRGCHTLISDGAKLTTNIEDILDEIGPLISAAQKCKSEFTKQSRLHVRLDEQSKLLLDNIGYDSITVDQLVCETGFALHTVTILLFDLELNGLVESLPGGRFARKM
jgi:DNA processing protein